MPALKNPCADVPNNIDITTKLTQEEQNEAFRQEKLKLDSNTFGLALVLGGTVSAGAFTAGVLDFLMEALDEWQRIRDEEDRKVQNGEMQDDHRTVPKHKVSLTIITGSSGGGVCGAILSRFLGYRFPHVRLNPACPETANQPEVVLNANTDSSLKPADNPFWNVWVEKLRIDGMLTDKNANESLLSADVIDDAAESIALGPQTKLAMADRSWIHDKFNLVLALTNLRGIPTKIEYMGSDQSFAEHADYIRFGIAPTVKKQFNRQKACHESALFGPVSMTDEWKEFAQFAMATGAFPVGFPARELNRCITDYRFRPVIVPTETPSGVEPKQLPIDVVALAEQGIERRGEYNFYAVDAGVTDNAPVELARTYLSGIGGRNNRNSKDADRAVILIDPFAEKVKIEKGKNSLLTSFIRLVLGLVEESRYHTRDLQLAADPKVKSRFLLTAFRPRIVGSDDKALGGRALCSTRLGAFFGFFDKEYSKHDYFLGRYCCREFLNDSTQPWIADVNTVLGLGIANLTGKHLPIIPLVGSASEPQKLPAWPKWNKFDPESLREKIKNRLKCVIEAQSDSATEGLGFGAGLFTGIWFWLNKIAIVPVATDKIINAIKAAKSDITLPPL